MASRKKVEFDPKELRGSRLRCLMLTSGSRRQVAERLTDLVALYARVSTWDKDQNPDVKHKALLQTGGSQRQRRCSGRTARDPKDFERRRIRVD